MRIMRRRAACSHRVGIARAAAIGLLLVDTLARVFELREDRIDLRRIGHELLHALHAFVGHFLGHVAIVELRDAALRVRENLEADLRDRVFRFRRLAVGRQRAQTLRELRAHFRRFGEGEERVRVGLVLRFRRNMQRFDRTVLGRRHIRVDDRELEVAHLLLHRGAEAARDEGAHQHHRGLALEQERLRGVEVVGQRVIDEIAGVEQLLPRRVDLLHARVGVRHFARHELLVELVAVQAQVEIIEPARECPRVASAHGDRRDAGGFELLAVVEKLVPGFRLVRDADLLEQVLTIEHAPRVIDRGRGVLLAVVRGRFLRRGIHGVPAVLLPVAAQVFEQAALRVERHALAVVPVHDVGRRGREPVRQLHLVRFLIDERHLHVRAGVRLLELVDHLGPYGALARALERDIHFERAGLCRGRERARERGGRERDGDEQGAGLHGHGLSPWFYVVVSAAVCVEKCRRMLNALRFMPLTSDTPRRPAARSHACRSRNRYRRSWRRSCACRGRS
ncbi:hypothetical protein PT2222_70185 [Paraburkholderia tropica]